MNVFTHETGVNSGSLIKRLATVVGALISCVMLSGIGCSSSSSRIQPPNWAGPHAQGVVPLATAPVLAAAILPSSRSVVVGSAATAAATIINGGGSAATGCSIALATNIPATFAFQATNPVGAGPSNAVNIAPGVAQNFLLIITPTAPFAPTDVAFTFACSNASPAGSISGVNTLLLSASSSPVPDVVALAAAATPGILDIPGLNGAGAFSVATVNVGASGAIAVSADTGSVGLPISLAVCQTNPTSGQCQTPAGPSVSTPIGNGATPTFAVFAAGAAQVPFAPGSNRVFVRFRDSGGLTRGSTSVAVRTLLNCTGNYSGVVPTNVSGVACTNPTIPVSGQISFFGIAQGSAYRGTGSIVVPGTAAQNTDGSCIVGGGTQTVTFSYDGTYNGTSGTIANVTASIPAPVDIPGVFTLSNGQVTGSFLGGMVNFACAVR